MNLLPVSIIIFNHRSPKLLSQTVSSVMWAAEILIFDYQSDFDYQKIKSEKKVKVIYQKKYLTDFSLERNLSLKKAHYDWVFFLDSDEVLESAAEVKIARLINKKHISGIRCTRVDIFYDRPLRFGEVKDIRLLRLAKKNRIHFEHVVHETARIGGMVINSRLKIFHYAHQNIGSFFAKITRYSAMVAQERSQISKSQLILEMLFYPSGKFIFNLIFKLGFLDGWRGVVYIFMMSLHSLCVRVFVYEKNL